MADDGRNRLAFDNICIQAQGAFKLYTAVVDKSQPGRVLDEKSPEVPELKVLWENCTNSSIAISLACCQSLVQLVKEGLADFRYVLTGILNTLPSASNLSGVVQAITSLLLLQVTYIKKQGNVYHCLYGLRNPPHPYISALTSRPDSAQLLVDQISLLLKYEYFSDQDTSATFSMLEPFLKFVLVDPRHSVDHTLRQQVHTTLLDAASNALSTTESSCCTKENISQPILNLLVSLLPYHQVDLHSIGHTTFLAQQLAQWMLRQTTWLHTKEHLVKSVVDYLLSLCHERLCQGLDSMTTLLVLVRMQQALPEVFYDATIVWSLAVVLMDSPALYSQQILNICTAVICYKSTKECPEVKLASIGIVLPVLSILSSPPAQCYMLGGNQSTKEMASKVLSLVEAVIHTGAWLEQEVVQVTDPLTSVSSMSSPWMSRMETCLVMVVRLLRDENAALHWLQCLKSSLPSRDHIPCHVVLLLSTLLLASSDNIASAVLQVLPILAQAVPSRSPYLLPLLLYKLGKGEIPELKLQTLYTIPELATHKLCVGPVLRTVQSLSLSPSLRPISLRLLCRLWQRQSRIFPHLHKALIAAETGVQGGELLMELRIAKAAVIRDMCKDRPSQHGGDLLGMLSTLINENARHSSAVSDSTFVIVSLALQGIKALCEAEVVDLCTAWRVLAPKLSHDRRPAVVRSLCELFALVPSLPTDTQEYENFKEDVLTFLWRTTQHEIPWVAGSAFAALSTFQGDDFKLLHLPEEISAPIRDKLLSTRKIEEEEDIEEVTRAVNNTTPPGSAYIHLMHRLHRSTLPDFQKFLTSLLREEASSIPRGVIHKASRARKSRDWVLTGIPSFLQSQYERTKTPGLNQGLAAGLLFSFEPPFEEHQGKRVRRYHVHCARSYRHMLDSLLHEVPIQPSEWHRNMLLPQGWTMFMTKLYSACVQGRKAELAMQESRGHLKDPEELRDKLNNAWLWIRDQLTEQLKSASRGNPSVQGNSVLALSGLAFAVSSYLSQQSLGNQSDESMTNKADQEGQYQRTKEWLGMVADTLMVVLDGNYKARGSTLVWCKQVSSPTSTASSLLARASAALALSQLVPVLVTLDPERIKNFTKALKLRLPGQSKSGSSAVIQMHCGLGLGLLLSKLYEEHFSELAGNEGYLLMTTALDALENVALSTDLENTEGATLGMGVALSSLCKENIVDSRVHLQAMNHKLKGLVHDYQKDPDQRLQTLCFSFSLVSANAFHTGLLSAADASQYVTILHHLANKHDQAIGVSLSLGLFMHGLVTCGHTDVTELVTQQLGTWRSWIENKDLPALQQLCGVNGIMGLLGSERAFFQVESSVDLDKFGKGTLSGILKVLQTTVSSAQDVGLATNIAWLLGHVYASSTLTSLTRTSVPDSYGYLPEASTLRAVFDFLVLAGKTGPHLHFSSTAVNGVLESLVTGPRVGLPPVNWASVLGPIMRSAFGKKTDNLCLQFAVVQAKSSSSLPSFLSSWLSSRLFSGLQDECKQELYQSLSKLINVVPSTRVQEFLQGPVMSGFDPVKGGVTSRAILIGVQTALELNDPPPSVFGWTSSALENLYSKCTQDMSISTINLLGKCFAQIPPENVDRLTQAPDVKSVIIRCHLVGCGQAKLKWLNTCVTHMMFSSDFDPIAKDQILWYVVQALCASSNTKHKMDDRLHWLLDLTSQIRNIATDDHVTDSAEVVGRGLILLSAASMCWSNSRILFDLELGEQSLPKEDNHRVFDSHKLIDSGQIDQRICLNTLLRMLPGNLLDLLSQEPWTHILAKMLEWLFALRGSTSIHGSTNLQKVFEDSVLAFRHTDAFKKVAMWTEAVTRMAGGRQGSG